MVATRRPTVSRELSRQKRSAAATWAVMASSLAGEAVAPLGVTLTMVRARAVGSTSVGSVVATTSVTSRGAVPAEVA